MRRIACAAERGKRMSGLPVEFEKRMKEMLGEEYEDYLESFREERRYGLRTNRMKTSPEELARLVDFPLRPVPWTENGCYYEWAAAPARHPFYAAGLYYLQEPSAMTPAALFQVEPGERVLDLCAAPGGKATELGAKLQGKGVLVANDISSSRAKALLRNLELFGIPNLLVTNETPDRLTEYFPEFFDKILVDAPCSGEGMFRKDPAVARAWYPEKPRECAAMQREILSGAVKMLRPGGRLLYSTCTFAPEENEGTISWFTEHFPQMRLLPLEQHDGFSRGVPEWGNGDRALELCVRLWPHKLEGEGHFLALLEKAETTGQEGVLEGEEAGEKEEREQRERRASAKRQGRSGKAGRASREQQEQRELLREFFAGGEYEPCWERLAAYGERVYQLPELPENLRGIHFLRNGLFLGEIKKNRFEPSQPLALCLRPQDAPSALDMKAQDPRVERYLRGETISVEQGEVRREKGWQLVCVEGFALGWGKLVNGVLKNKYLCSWRRN